VLTKDHREVEALFRRYERLGGKAEKSKRTIVRKLVEELSKHAAAEEQVLYPAMRSMLPDGATLQEEGIEEHQTVKELLVDLDRLSPGDEEFDPKMRALMESVRHHVKEEESEMLPKLADAAGREQLISMGKMIEGAKKIAPTRPHPHAPSTPPANIVVGAVAGVVDRVRDAGRKVLSGEG
jgi:hemerythrin superfamily protein